MSETIYSVYVSFFSDNECKNVINTTIIGNYIYPCNENNCYNCNYIEEDHQLIFNICYNNQTWFCKKEEEEKDEIIEYIIMWATFVVCCCCIFWCCYK